MTDTVPRSRYNAVCKEVEDAKAKLAKVQADAGARIEALERFKQTVIGWRENDWPEGFDRRSAELLAERASEELEQGDQ